MKTEFIHNVGGDEKYITQHNFKALNRTIFSGFYSKETIKDMDKTNCVGVFRVKYKPSNK